MAVRSKTSSSSSISIGSSSKKSFSSPPPSSSTSTTANTPKVKNAKKETRQDQRTTCSTVRASSLSAEQREVTIEAAQSPPPPPKSKKQPKKQQKQQQQLDEEQSLTQDYLDLDLDIDQLNEDLRLQQEVVSEKEEEVKFWNQILSTQRANIDNDVKHWTKVLQEATAAHKKQYEQGIQKWNGVWSEANIQRGQRYDGEMKRWQREFDGATSSRDFKLLREEFKRLESNRYAPTAEMKEASAKLKELEESIASPSAEMTKAQEMIDSLVAKRDIPTKDLALTSKKEKRYVKNVMRWQNALAEATEKHRHDCDKWEEALADAQSSKKMKRVRRMLQRLLVTSDVPSADMETALMKLEELEKEEEDAHGIVMRYAGSTVYRLEEELKRFREELKLTKTLIGRAVDASGLPNSFDDDDEDDSTVSGEEEEEEEEEEGSTYGDEECFSWLCGATDVTERSGCTE
eukprot:CAMPEP_0201689474 /NCGR_PEP_ID=MMETSP0578-20130828/3045_1 /ASSEMBLY_ACC=CAM_ASM_000663 /TAXON_ID=267565 /ORGANISM="Skeletonema grethea, Strain CCMP 1804" /LENGTH=459 /DNA_ID=CAMNT_0048174113 /DNA_START=106 /DNA_END=1485 /DNA_ORIENTATION=-